MLKKVRFILLFISLSVCLCLMSNTYSRYVASTNGSINAAFSKWQILVNTSDISDNSVSSISFTPTIEDNEFIKAGTVAPSSKGYFDIAIDPSNVEVSFKYNITLSLGNTNIPDLLITKYAYLPSDYIEGDPLELNTILDSTITNNFLYDNETPDFAFDTFTIRVYFEWFEGTGETMSNEADTEVATEAGENDTKLIINADVTFEQIFE